MAEYRFNIRIRMTEEETDEYRCAHSLGEDDSVREYLAHTIAVELSGLGSERGWWHQPSVR